MKTMAIKNGQGIPELLQLSDEQLKNFYRFENHDWTAKILKK